MEWIKTSQDRDNIFENALIIRPQIGDVACGLFGIAEDYEEAYLSLDQHMIKNREATYFLRARGESMAPMINPGDILVVDRSVKAIHGQVIALTLNGERLCKRLCLRSGRVSLLSDNPKCRTIDVVEEMEFAIFGVVVGIVRSLRLKE